MAHGKLECLGSSLFLKRLFGVGYSMTVSKTSEATSEQSQALLSVIKEHVPAVEVLSDVAAEVSYRLPLTMSKAFPSMFDAIDGQLKPVPLYNLLVI
jgi:ATP-binding cassette subfamily A (ABC1) protein 3